MFGRKKRRAEAPPPAEENSHHNITSGNRTLRPMRASDVPRALDIIESHDEDDAEEALAGYQEIGGIIDNFVMVNPRTTLPLQPAGIKIAKPKNVFLANNWVYVYIVINVRCF